jgi:hypothetical protein
MSSTKAPRWARCPPGLAWKRPGLPTEWIPVLERNEEAMEPEPRPGYVWVEVHGCRLHVWADHLEFQVDGS